MKKYSERSTRVGTCKIRSMTLEAYKRGAIMLAQGSPGFDTPEHIKKAAIESIVAGHNQYAPMIGYKELREAVSEKLKSYNKIEADPESEVIITVGAMEGLSATMLGLVDPDDEVILINPCFSTNRASVEMAHGKKVEVPLEGDELKLNEEAMKGAVTGKTRAILLNSPQNPSGRVLGKGELKAIADIAMDKDLFVLSDEIYEYLLYDGNRHHSIGSFDGMQERTVTLSGFSKTYAMTGWRVGYVTCEKELMKPITELHTHLVIAAPSMGQHAALAALKGPQDCVEEMRNGYEERRDYIVPELEKLGLKPFMPQGAYYVFSDVSGLGMDGDAFTEKALEEANVAVVPGEEFGEEWKSYVRMNFSRPMKELENAVESLGRVF
ncbi:MAG: pyridoxal phosphate-dependent aminotransferase [archaeon]